MFYDTLCTWWLHCDRKEDKGIIVPFPHIEKAIRDAAKAEDRELEAYPWETGKDHERRIAKLTETSTP